MAGYTRQSTGQIINGSPITAPPLNSEFNQVAAAFNATTGHGHTGGAGDAPQIPLATSVSGYLPAANGGNGGKNNFAATSTPLVSNDNTQGYAPGSMWENTTTGRVYVCVGSSTGAAVWRELTTVISNNQITPATHNTVDLGTPSVRFQDLYLQGGISAVGNVTVGGALNSTSLTTTGTITVGSTIDINGGTIDGTVVGGSSAQAVTGTVVTATTNFAGDLTGNVTGNVTGNSAGTHTGAVIGDVTGNITAASGTSSVNNLTVNGTLNMNAGTSATIENLSAPSNANDAARKADVDAVNAAKLNLAGGTMSGDIAMGSNTVSGLGAPSASTDAATKGYVDTSVSNLVDSAPGTLDTLNELAAALGDDPNFSTTLTNSIATKLPLAGGTMTGDIVLGANKATSTATPATDDTLTRKGYVDTQDALKLPKAGGTMSGAIAMGTNKITGLGDPTANQDASTKAYTDTQRDTRLPLAGGSMTGGITMGNNKVTATYTPSANIDLTNKSYVDGILGSATSAATSAASAATSATNAGTSATNASNSAAAALVSQNAAAASYDSFDDRYLGAKSSAPSTDNDGNALLTGALYWNSSSNGMYAWSGSAWVLTTNYNDAAVDTHLNTGTAASGEFLSWNGSDYDWAAAGADLYAANESSPTNQPSATGNNAVAIGDGAQATGIRSFAGPNSKASGTDSVALGGAEYNYDHAQLLGCVAIGYRARARAGYYNIAIGRQAHAFNGTTTSPSIALGYTASASGNFATAIGPGGSATGESAVVIGGNSHGTASGYQSIAIGPSATATANYSFATSNSRASGSDSFAAAIGSSSSSFGAQHDNSVALGFHAVTTAEKQIALGDSTAQVKVSGAYTLPTADGSANQVLTTNGSGAVTFVDAAGAADDIFYENNTTVASNYTITSGKNAMTAGPVTIASGVTVTVPSGSRWAVV